MRRAALIAAMLTLALAGCGGTQEREPGPGIPRKAVRALDAELKLVQDRLDVTRDDRAPGSCQDIELKSYPEIDRIVEGLPADTDRDRVRALRRSLDRLRELTNQECSSLVQEIEDEQSQTDEAPPETEEAPPETETAPPETETTPPQTQPEQTVPTVPEQQPTAPQTPNPPSQGGGAEAPGSNGR